MNKQLNMLLYFLAALPLIPIALLLFLIGHIAGVVQGSLKAGYDWRP